MKTNEAVNRTLKDEAVHDDAVEWALRMTLFWAVDRTLDRAVFWAGDRAVLQAVLNDPPHTSLADFLSEVIREGCYLQ